MFAGNPEFQPYQLVEVAERAVVKVTPILAVVQGLEESERPAPWLVCSRPDSAPQVGAISKRGLRVAIQHERPVEQVTLPLEPVFRRLECVQVVDLQERVAVDSIDCVVPKVEGSH
ncbi:hypothetical protein K0M31_008553 [Melipona bicolor]|uniref:Uncharacterized protein n=1 Tax=Melipona bicolor TaxID=60889 RepID=A0AA40FR80_9HYME|nr:hypothetical protein K0M31_008553 [Melipona bicolor]